MSLYFQSFSLRSSALVERGSLFPSNLLRLDLFLRAAQSFVLRIDSSGATGSSFSCLVNDVTVHVGVRIVACDEVGFPLSIGICRNRASNLGLSISDQDRKVPDSFSGCRTAAFIQVSLYSKLNFAVPATNGLRNDWRRSFKRPGSGEKGQVLTREPEFVRNVALVVIHLALLHI